MERGSYRTSKLRYISIPWRNMEEIEVDKENYKENKTSRIFVQ